MQFHRTLIGFVTSALFAGISVAAEPATLSETTWAYLQSTGTPGDANYFAADGTIYIKSSVNNLIYNNRSWRQDGTRLIIEDRRARGRENNGLSIGEIAGDRIEGHPQTSGAPPRPWVLVRQSEAPAELRTAAAAQKPVAPALIAPLTPDELDGTYEGRTLLRKGNDTATMIWRFRCKAGVCERGMFFEVAGKEQGQFYPSRLRNPDQHSNLVNESLQMARINRGVTPKDPNTGTLQASIRSLLDSDAVFDRCMDLQDGSAHICHASINPWFGSRLYLLLGDKFGDGFGGHKIFPLKKQ